MAEPQKKRRVVRRSKRIPPISELYKEAYDRGMTVPEYVNYLNQIHSGRKGPSSYDLGPLGYRNRKPKKEKDA